MARPSLEFEGGHDARADLGVEVDALLAGGFGDVDHAGEGEVGVAGIAGGLLEEAIDEVRCEAFVAPDSGSAADWLDGLGAVGLEMGKSLLIKEFLRFLGCLTARCKPS